MQILRWSNDELMIVKDAVEGGEDVAIVKLTIWPKEIPLEQALRAFCGSPVQRVRFIHHEAESELRDYLQSYVGVTPEKFGVLAKLNPAVIQGEDCEKVAAAMAFLHYKYKWAASEGVCAELVQRNMAPARHTVTNQRASG